MMRSIKSIARFCEYETANENKLVHAFRLCVAATKIPRAATLDINIHQAEASLAPFGNSAGEANED